MSRAAQLRHGRARPALLAAGWSAVFAAVGYLLWGGSQWWNWGQLTPLPLLLLLMRDSFKDAVELELAFLRRHLVDAAKARRSPPRRLVREAG